MNIRLKIFFYWLLLLPIISNGQSSKNNLKSLDKVTYDFLQLVRAYEGPSIIDLNIKETRVEIAKLQETYDVKHYEVTEERINVSINDQGDKVELIIVKPKNTTQKKITCIDVLSWWWLGVRRLWSIQTISAATCCRGRLCSGFYRI